MNITAYRMARRFIGVKEIAGTTSNPLVLAMLKLDNDWPTDDEVPWCAAFMNFVCWLLELPRSKSLRARSFLAVGEEVDEPKIGFDIVILKRGIGNQPGPEVLDAPGHVGFFGGFSGEYVNVLGGNQSDSVKVSRYPKSRILGIRRLWKE